MNNKKEEEKSKPNFSSNFKKKSIQKIILDNIENESTKNEENSLSLSYSDFKNYGRKSAFNFSPINFSIKDIKNKDKKNKEKEELSLIKEEKNNSNKLNNKSSEEFEDESFCLFNENKTIKKKAENEIDNNINFMENQIINKDELLGLEIKEKELSPESKEEIGKILETIKKNNEKNKNYKKKFYPKEEEEEQSLNSKVTSKSKIDLEILKKEEKEEESKDDFKTYIQTAYDDESDYKIIFEFQKLPYKPKIIMVDLNAFDENSIFKCIIQCNFDLTEEKFFISLNFVYLSNQSELYSLKNKDEILMNYFLEKQQKKENNEEEYYNNEYNSENQVTVLIILKRFRMKNGEKNHIGRDKKAIIKKDVFEGFQTITIDSKEDLVNYINYHKLFYILQIKKTILLASKKELKIKKIGILNEGNTCYMNSIIQSINNNPFLLKNIMSINIDSEIFLNKENKKNKDIIFSLQNILYKLNTKKYAIKIIEIFYSFQWKRVFWNSPQDAEEIYMEIYEIISSFNKEIKNNCEGIMENTIEVEEIKYKSSREENFFFLQLDIENNNSLDECLENFFKGEKLTGENKYQYINENGEILFFDAIKYFKFKKIPNILFIQLKRFQYDSKTFEFTKNNTGISYKEEIDLSNYLEKNKSRIKSKNKKRKIEKEEYTLYCVIVHSGSAQYGHYYCFAKDFKNKCYIKYNDTSVNVAEKKEVFNHNYGGEEIEYEIKNISEYKDNPVYEVRDSRKEITKNAYIFIYIKKDKINELFDNANNQIKELFENFSKNINEESENYKSKNYTDEEEGLKKFLNIAPKKNYKDLNLKTIQPRIQKDIVQYQYPTNYYQQKKRVNKINMTENKNFDFANAVLKMSKQGENEKQYNNYYKKIIKNNIITTDKRNNLISPIKSLESELNDIKTNFYLIDDISERIKGVFYIEYNTKLIVKNIQEKIRSQLIFEKAKNKIQILEKIIESSGYRIILLNCIGFFIRFLEDEEEDITNLLKHEKDDKIKIKHLCLYNFKEFQDTKRIINNAIIINFLSKNFLDLIISKNEDVYENFNFENINPPAFIINEEISELKFLIERIKDIYINYFGSNAIKNIKFKIYIIINKDILNCDFLKIEYQEMNEINFEIYINNIEPQKNKKISYVNLIVGI